MGYSPRSQHFNYIPSKPIIQAKTLELPVLNGIYASLKMPAVSGSFFKISPCRNKFSKVMQARKKKLRQACQSRQKDFCRLNKCFT